jgi:hypothetical protein
MTPLLIKASTIQLLLQTARSNTNTGKDIKEYGQINFKRRVGEEQAFTRGLSQVHAGASILIRANYGTEAENKLSSIQRIKREQQQERKQENQIEAWAKANDL